MVTEFFNKNFSEEGPDGETGYHRNTEGGKTRMPCVPRNGIRNGCSRGSKEKAECNALQKPQSVHHCVNIRYKQVKNERTKTLGLNPRA